MVCWISLANRLVALTPTSLHATTLSKYDRAGLQR